MIKGHMEFSKSFNKLEHKNYELQAHINVLREALKRIAQNKYSGLSTASLPPIDQRALWAEQALAQTPAQSLQAFENDVIERCAKVCENNELSWADTDWNNAVNNSAKQIRALKSTL